VRALGGVRIITGHTSSGRELGVALEPGSSAWSVLSDSTSKENVVPVDPRTVLRALVDKVPISHWQYEEPPEGAAGEKTENTDKIRGGEGGGRRGIWGRWRRIWRMPSGSASAAIRLRASPCFLSLSFANEKDSLY